MTSVSASNIILTPTQPLGSGRPQQGSNPGPPHQESCALPNELQGPPVPMHQNRNVLSCCFFFFLYIYIYIYTENVIQQAEALNKDNNLNSRTLKQKSKLDSIKKEKEIWKINVLELVDT